MPPVVVAAVAAGGAVASGVAKHIAIKKAEEKARKQEKAAQSEVDAATQFKEDNPYEIPTEATNGLALAKHELGNSRTQAEMERMADEKLARNVGQINRTATSSTDALAALSKANTEAGYDKGSAALAGAQEYQQDVANLYNRQDRVSDYKSIQYDQNINMPYLQRMEFAQGKLGLATQMGLNAGAAKLDNTGWIGRTVSSGASAYLAAGGGNPFGGGGGKKKTPNYNAEEGWYGG